MHENKSFIKHRFNKNIKTYDQHAFVQKNTASELIGMLIENCGKNFGDIYEIGCGTGILTRQIVEKLNFNKLYANDIVESCEEFVKNLSDKITFIAGDAETMQIDKKFDLIVSNAAFQWFSDFPTFLTKINSNLNDNGILAFASFGPENLYEISKITGCGLKYPSITEIETTAKSYFDCVISCSETIEVIFDSPLDVLKHIKYSGTNGLATKHWVKKNLVEFEQNYRELFSVQDGVHLTHNPIWFILKKLP
jgi:malonyl-CoA O-methyltransferase